MEPSITQLLTPATLDEARHSLASRGRDGLAAELPYLTPAALDQLANDLQPEGFTAPTGRDVLGAADLQFGSSGQGKARPEPQG